MVVAHSAGATHFFYGLNQNAEFWNNRLSLFVGLSPITKLEYSNSKFLNLVNDDYLHNGKETRGEVCKKSTEPYTKLCFFFPELCSILDGTELL